MVTHRRPGALARMLRRSAPVEIPVSRPPGIEMVDVRSGVRHRVSTEAMLASRLADGRCRALCGMTVLSASLTDPGRSRCRRCAS